MSSSNESANDSQSTSKEVATSTDSETLQLEDPLTILPEELLSHLLFPLSPSSIAASSAVCRAWREAILSDSTLHTEVDLSKVEWRRQVMSHFIRLSSRSRNRLTKVSLNLSSFWQDNEYLFYDDDDVGENEDYPPTNLESLIEQLQLSKGTLRDISLILRDDGEESFDEPVASANTLPFLTPLIHSLFKDFSSLKRISIKAPTYVTIKAGKEEEDRSKYFGLEDTSWSAEKSDWIEDAGFEEEINIDQSEFGPERLELMQLAVNFAGIGLTEFGGGSWVWGLESRQILTKLWASTSTLETIGFWGFDFSDQSLRKEVWNKATKCSKLVRFNLSGPRERMHDDFYDSGDELIVETLKISEESKILKMNIKSFNMKWEQIAGLVKDLEKFSIDFEGSLRRGRGLFSSRAFEKIILRFKGTLKTLELSGINCGSDTPPDSQINLLFPNLEFLSLINVQYIVMSLFSKIKSPKLRNVSFESERHPGDAFDSLLSILKEHDLQLVEVACGSNRNGIAQSKKEVFSFPKLEKLSIYGGDQSLVDFFSKFDYPNLTQIHPEIKERFAKRSPKLEKGKDSE